MLTTVQFFLDIWEGLQDRARQANSIGSMTVADVAERTSKSVGGDDDGGALFDETALWYARLRDRSEKIIIDTLNNSVREALRPYRHMYVSQIGTIERWTKCLLLAAIPGQHLAALQPRPFSTCPPRQKWTRCLHT